VDAAPRHATFVVRVSGSDPGQVSGVIICVSTGERVAFRGLHDAGAVLMRSIAKDMPRASDEDLT
jgi:hypothetical protein